MVPLVLVLVLTACAADASISSGDASACRGDAALGATLVGANACAACHGRDLGGNGAARAPNLTPAGLVGWSEADIARALSLGVNREGSALCASMPRYARLSERERCDIAAYLRALAPVARQVADSCD
jgi:cytochrome c553